MRDEVVMIARAKPECCLPVTYDDFPCCSWPTWPDKFTVTIGPVSDCDHPDTLAQEVAEIIAMGMIEFEGGI